MTVNLAALILTMVENVLNITHLFTHVFPVHSFVLPETWCLVFLPFGEIVLNILKLLKRSLLLACL